MSASNNPDWLPPPPGEFLGHPKALWNLFGSEFWERFMYYGMRAMLAVHVAAAFFSHLGPGADAQASVTYGGFTSLVYMTGICSESRNCAASRLINGRPRCCDCRNVVSTQETTARGYISSATSTEVH